MPHNVCAMLCETCFSHGASEGHSGADTHSNSTLCCPVYSFEDCRPVAEVKAVVEFRPVCNDDGSNRNLIEWDFRPRAVASTNVCLC